MKSRHSSTSSTSMRFTPGASSSLSNGSKTPISMFVQLTYFSFQCTDVIKIHSLSEMAEVINTYVEKFPWMDKAFIHGLCKPLNYPLMSNPFIFSYHVKERLVFVVQPDKRLGRLSRVRNQEKTRREKRK